MHALIVYLTNLTAELRHRVDRLRAEPDQGVTTLELAIAALGLIALGTAFVVAVKLAGQHHFGQIK